MLAIYGQLSSRLAGLSLEERNCLLDKFVEVGEVHAHPSLPGTFLYHDYIGEPVGVEDFPDEVRR
jgi:hypothetical protein